MKKGFTTNGGRINVGTSTSSALEVVQTKVKERVPTGDLSNFI
jgi:hypothetical protein